MNEIISVIEIWDVIGIEIEFFFVILASLGLKVQGWNYFKQLGEAQIQKLKPKLNFLEGLPVQAVRIRLNRITCDLLPIDRTPILGTCVG